MKPTETIWHNGEYKPWHEATTHVLSHALHYGSSVFEGIRVYEKNGEPFGFRMHDHVKRMYDCARVYRMVIPYDYDTIYDACRGTVNRNGLKSAYLRPIAFRGYGTIGVAAGKNTPIDVAIAAIEWGAYLGEEAREKGARVCVSSWQRVAPNTIPAGVKAGGNYLSSQLISMEAHRLGYDEGIGLASDGTLSEGAGENLFMIRNGVLLTPPQSEAILSGITRDTVIRLAHAMGYEVREQPLSRESLYTADELFFTGTAAEITPIASVDDLDIGSGSRGVITEKIQSAFFGLFSGETEDSFGWLEPIADNAAGQRQVAHG
ncbi:branched-chain amino acid transaminase [Marinihelvus fidelis]|uniref:Branched-chain-amino-acid aminotransferase n=1 Tax=Marinihelvus fidelis TaxID=2613842 RepID=A0A5N0THN6_9GAMM|nr:branched-chain amino acid transaminase [Marinihelvus fidelis]KAA9133998.1 branched-chain amino acid transaminase [Marinihelvus fidelis]